MTTMTERIAPAAPAAVSLTSAFDNLFVRGYKYPLVLAIRDDDNAMAAIRMANALAGRGAEPAVIEATELMVPVEGSPNAMIAFPGQILAEEHRRTREQALRNLITTHTGRGQAWPVVSVAGDPVACIIEEAASRRAEVIVLGIHQHGAMEQALGENTATRVMGHSDVPVFGVRQAMTRVPRRIMVAVDFGRASAAAAQIAANLADRNGTVVLAHVELPSPVVDEGDEGAALVQREGVNAAFEQLTKKISEGKRIRVERALRTGDAGAQLIAMAESADVDLIVVARQRHNVLTRLMLGSTSRRLVRAGKWSVLVTPPLHAEGV